MCDEVKKHNKPSNNCPSSPKHLEELLDNIFEPISSNAIDIVYRAYYWLAYNGVPAEEVFDLTEDNFFFRKKRIFIKGKMLEMFDESVPTIKKATLATEFVVKHKKYETKVPRIEGDRILRGWKSQNIGNEDGFKSGTSRRMSKALKDGKIPFKLTYLGCFRAGYFYRALQAEKVGVVPTFMDYVLAHSKSNVHNNIIALARAMRADYREWKNRYGY